MNRIRTFLRKFESWNDFRDLSNEGWLNAFYRSRIQPRILSTLPVKTELSGERSVHMVTWKRDYLNAMWALKSFYHFSEIKFPLYIHDGGLTDVQKELLRSHFPNANIVLKNQFNEQIDNYLTTNSLYKLLAYRKKNIAMVKLLEFFFSCESKQIISIDSDIVFFKRPHILIENSEKKNFYNKDCQYAYSMTLENIKSAFGLSIIPYINSGLSLIHRESVLYSKLNHWLDNKTLFSNDWVTEQTLHALLGAEFGVELLPEDYMVSTELGIKPKTICKHYPGFYRPYLYQEGMNYLVKNSDFLSTSTKF